MAQVIDIINMSLASIGAIAPGEPIDPSLSSQAFMMLNMLLDSSSNDDFAVISVQETIATTTANVQTMTIGVGGQINATRPLSINSAFARVAGIDYPIRILNVEQYELIGLKLQPGAWPTAIYYNSGVPLGTIYMWPISPTFELHLFSNQIFTQFSTINDTIQFAQGYQMWLMWALAELLMPSYGRTNDQGLVAAVRDNKNKAFAAIKSTNMQPPQIVRFDSAIIGGRVQDAGWIMNGGF